MLDLKKLLEEYPHLVKKFNSEKLLGVLKDLNPGDNARNNIIVALLKNGFVEEMQNNTQQQIPVAYYCSRMENDYGYSADLAGECIEMWANALGLEDRLATVSIVTPGGIKINYESADLAKKLITTNDYCIEINTLLYDTNGEAYLEFWAGNGSSKAIDVYLHDFTLDGVSDKEFINLGTIKSKEAAYLYIPIGKLGKSEDHYASFSVVLDNKTTTFTESGNVNVNFNATGRRFTASVA